MSASAADPPKPSQPSLLGVALAFAAISSTAFGGGQKASIRQQVVSRGWMDHEGSWTAWRWRKFCPARTSSTWRSTAARRCAGLPGAVAAFLGASVPPFVIILIAGALYFKFASNPYVHGGLRGCAVGALGLTLGNALELSWDERTDWVRILLLVATALVVSIFRMPLLLVLVVFGGIGIVHEYLRARPKRARPK